MPPRRPTGGVRRAAPLRDNLRYALPGSEFKRLAVGRGVLYVRTDLVAEAYAIASAASRPPSDTNGAESSSGAGNRNSGFPLKLDNGTELFIRYARRGGLMCFLNSSLYLGVTPRPLAELAVMAEARRRGLPVAEPLGAMVKWLAPGLYRGAFITRRLYGMTLWQLMQTDDDPAVRAHVIEEARRAINSAHEKGLFHADLNLHNLFVSTASESFTVVLLDLDKARFYASSLTQGLRENNFSRLRRSINKLDGSRRYFSREMITVLTES
jgi:hypothetical protein